MDISQIYATYYPKILRYLKRMLGPDEAADAAQEVFVKVERFQSEARDPRKTGAWIYKIASNAALDVLRKKARGRGIELESDAPPEIAALDERAECASAHLEQELVRREMNACIREVVDGLPGNYRIMIAMSDLMGYANAEIAQHLGISQGTVKIRLHRARAYLKKELEKHCEFYRNDDNELSCDRKVAS